MAACVERQGQQQLSRQDSELRRVKEALDKCSKDLRRTVDETALLQQELNKWRLALNDKDSKLSEANSSLKTAQDELSKWYRKAIQKEKEMEAFKSEHERLQQQFDQIANRKLLALTEKGHVFELSSGNRAASAP